MNVSIRGLEGVQTKRNKVAFRLAANSAEIVELSLQVQRLELQFPSMRSMCLQFKCWKNNQQEDFQKGLTAGRGFKTILLGHPHYLLAKFYSPHIWCQDRASCKKILQRQMEAPIKSRSGCSEALITPSKPLRDLIAIEVVKRVIK